MITAEEIGDFCAGSLAPICAGSVRLRFPLVPRAGAFFIVVLFAAVAVADVDVALAAIADVDAALAAVADVDVVFVAAGLVAVLLHRRPGLFGSAGIGIGGDIDGRVALFLICRHRRRRRGAPSCYRHRGVLGRLPIAFRRAAACPSAFAFFAFCLPRRKMERRIYIALSDQQRLEPLHK